MAAAMGMTDLLNIALEHEMGLGRKTVEGLTVCTDSITSGLPVTREQFQEARREQCGIRLHGRGSPAGKKSNENPINTRG
jgi:hypothetical protein